MTAKDIELWGGIECSLNRVGDRYFDQLAFSGHDRRTKDLDLAASLGIRAIRYPLLWEKHQPHPGSEIDWSWADERLARLRRLGTRPIVGFVHHGSGPRCANIASDDFARGLAMYAAVVARRFPWVNDYTPVNEPLTTARFCGLYGHWHPHGRDRLLFCRVLLNQCRAIVLAMEAIRRVNPAARLIQTDDLGKTFSTRPLAYQADFDNERRWLGWDLLCGRVDRAHPMRHYMCWAGCRDAEVDWFLDHPCPPDVIGVDYYVTSERFLDHRIDRYPCSLHGGNERHRYVDIDAVRICSEGLAGPAALLRETWERYQIPIAITEAHLGCTREEQVRWFFEIWSAAQACWREGIDMRAVTAWSLFGAYDWNSLLTRCAGCYEPGVFDVRSPSPRPTALARLIRDLGRGKTHSHPVLAGRGWWRRDERLYPSALDDSTAPAASTELEGPPILIAGAGRLGQAMARICRARGLAHRLLSRTELDIANADNVEGVLAELEPWAIVNAAGFVRVNLAEADPDRCHRENTLGPTVLAEACAIHGLSLLTFSSDLVFDGRRRDPYWESHPVAPLNVYGRSKAAAETSVQRVLASALIVRTSALYGPWDGSNFLTMLLRSLAAGEPAWAWSDVTISPTYLPDLVHASLDLLIDRAEGIWHLANEGEATWADFAVRAARHAGHESSRIIPRSMGSPHCHAVRPMYSSLKSERSTLMPPMEHALARYFQDCSVDQAILTAAAV